jgi:type II secretory pathway pseudopilin PulG
MSIPAFGAISMDETRRTKDWRQVMTEEKKSSGLKIVLAVVGGCLLVAILAGVGFAVLVGIGVSSARKQATTVQTLSLIKETELAMGNFRLDYNSYPWPAAQPGQTVVIDPKAVYQELSGGPGAKINKQRRNYIGRLSTRFLKNGVMADYWGNPLEFEMNAKAFEPTIRSRGPDGKPGTKDDIRN